MNCFNEITAKLPSYTVLSLYVSPCQSHSKICILYHNDSIHALLQTVTQRGKGIEIVEKGIEKVQPSCYSVAHNPLNCFDSSCCFICHVSSFHA